MTQDNNTHTVVVYKGVSCPSEELNEALANLDFPSEFHEAHIRKESDKPGLQVTYVDSRIASKALAQTLVTVLAIMQQQGKVQLSVEPDGSVVQAATYTVTGADTELVHVDKDNPNGFEWFQMYHIASPMAEMHIRTDEAGLLETTVISADYNRNVKYTFTVVVPL